MNDEMKGAMPRTPSSALSEPASYAPSEMIRFSAVEAIGREKKIFRPEYSTLSYPAIPSRLQLAATASLFHCGRLQPKKDQACSGVTVLHL